MSVIHPKKFRASFRYAFRGLIITFREQQSFRIQLIMAAIVIFLMFYFPLSTLARAILLLTVSFVLSLELVNSIFEKAVDVFEPSINTRVKVIKDMMAGAVLIVALGSIVIGLVIFWPHFQAFLGQ